MLQNGINPSLFCQLHKIDQNSPRFDLHRFRFQIANKTVREFLRRRNETAFNKLSLILAEKTETVLNY